MRAVGLLAAGFAVGFVGGLAGATLVLELVFRPSPLPVPTWFVAAATRDAAGR